MSSAVADDEEFDLKLGSSGPVTSLQDKKVEELQKKNAQFERWLHSNITSDQLIKSVATFTLSMWPESSEWGVVMA